MRIIAGEHRGRKLEAPIDPPAARGEGVTRPITDRAKQSLFDVLTPWLGEGVVVADLFAGTGSMGLECLSRGVGKALFFEADRGALAGLRRNIEALRVQSSANVHAGDLFKLAPAALGDASGVEVMFLDPPYRFVRERGAELQELGGSLAKGIARDGVMSFRHDSADRLELPGWKVVRKLVFGSMTIELMQVRGG